MGRKLIIMLAAIIVIMVVICAAYFIILQDKDELISVSEDEITVLGLLEYVPYSYPISEAYQYPECRTGGLDIYFDFTETENLDSQKVVIFGQLKEGNWSDYKHLFAYKIEKNNWYDVTIKNKMLKLVIRNPLNVELSDLMVECSDLNEKNEKKIDKILPGESKELTWTFSSCKDMQSYTYISIKSECLSNGSSAIYDYDSGVFVYARETVHVSAEDCPIPAGIATFVETSVESVMVNNTFDVNATVENWGDLAAENVRCELDLPPELTTSEDLVKYIPKVGPHSEENITWTIKGEEGGYYSYRVNASIDDDSSSDYEFIAVIIYDHDIELSTDQLEIEADGELHIINMTIHNFGDMEDSIVLQYFVTNGSASFAIYDGSEQIIFQSVKVPANGNKTLSLEITPEYGVEENIEIYAVSELDPLAQDSIEIEVKRSSD